MALPAEGRFEAQVLIGEELTGIRYPFEPRAFEMAIWAGPERVQDLSRLPLNRGAPALRPMGGGLHALVVQAYPQRHRYADKSDFLDFVQSVGLAGRLNTDHPGIAADGSVAETYRRISKTLVHFGPDTGADRRYGTDHEWVRQPGGFRLYSGSGILADQPVMLACRNEATQIVAIKSLETDAEGRVAPSFPDDLTCLLNTVLLKRQADGSWFSDWVSILFRS